MAYTRAWDETQPPDTQLANLLGQDIRQLEQNISERVSSFGAGLFANRPTPEAVWGSANYGVLYYATDTNQIFRWNGATWLDVSSDFTLSDTTTVARATTGVLNTVTIPAASMRVGSIIEMTAVIISFIGGAAGSVSLNTTAGALYTANFAAGMTNNYFNWRGIVTAAGNILWHYSYQSDGVVPIFGSRLNSADVIANAIVLSTNTTVTAGVPNITPGGLIVRVRH